MSTYKEIKGFKVQTLATDTAASAVAGGAWASGGALTTGRNGLRGAGVSQTAVVVFGGNDGSTTGKTENYNGSSWSETTDLNTAKSNGLGVGTYTSALCTETGTNEKWNGSSWTELAELNTPRAEIGSFGTSTAALAIGNQNGSSGIVEQWNGSSWTEVGDLTTAMGSVCGFGTTSAGNAAGGYTGTVSATNNQIWDGSSWSEGSDLNQSRYFGGASGTSTLGLVFGGYKTQSPASQIANTESWDGTSFTEQADLSTARYVGAPAHNSTSSDALYAGGNPGNQSATEEWTAPSVFTQINLGQVYYNSTSNAFKVTEQPVPGGTWAAGGSLNDGRSSLTGIGIQTAVVAVSGQDSATSLIASVEEYNGSVWTEVNNTPVTLKYHGAGGILTAGWIAGGLTTYNGTAFNAETFEYDGTNWTDSGNINTNRYTAYGGGPQTAAFIAGGNNTSFAAVGNTELYNGSAWSETTDLNTARNNAFGNGTQTDGIYAGGSPGNKADTELWNGTTWTEVNNLNTARHSIGVGGGIAPGSSVLVAGGTDGTNNEANVETWNGTSWTEQANLAATNSSNGLGISSAASAINFGGFAPSPSTFATVTEEWTVPEVNQTITVS